MKRAAPLTPRGPPLLSCQPAEGNLPPPAATADDGPRLKPSGKRRAVRNRASPNENHCSTNHAPQGEAQHIGEQALGGSESGTVPSGYLPPPGPQQPGFTSEACFSEDIFGAVPPGNLPSGAQHTEPSHKGGFESDQAARPPLAQIRPETSPLQGRDPTDLASAQEPSRDAAARRKVLDGEGPPWCPDTGMADACRTPATVQPAVQPAQTPWTSYTRDAADGLQHFGSADLAQLQARLEVLLGTTPWQTPAPPTPHPAAGVLFRTPRHAFGPRGHPAHLTVRPTRLGPLFNIEASPDPSSKKALEGHHRPGHASQAADALEPENSVAGGTHVAETELPREAPRAQGGLHDIGPTTTPSHPFDTQIVGSCTTPSPADCCETSPAGTPAADRCESRPERVAPVGILLQEAPGHSGGGWECAEPESALHEEVLGPGGLSGTSRGVGNPYRTATPGDQPEEDRDRDRGPAMDTAPKRPTPSRPALKAGRALGGPVVPRRGGRLGGTGARSVRFADSPFRSLVEEIDSHLAAAAALRTPIALTPGPRSPPSSPSRVPSLSSTSDVGINASESSCITQASLAQASCRMHTSARCAHAVGCMDSGAEDGIRNSQSDLVHPASPASRHGLFSDVAESGVRVWQNARVPLPAPGPQEESHVLLPGHGPESTGEDAGRSPGDQVLHGSPEWEAAVPPEPPVSDHVQRVGLSGVQGVAEDLEALRRAELELEVQSREKPCTVSSPHVRNFSS